MGLPEGWVETSLDNLLEFVIGGDWGKEPGYEDDEFEDAYCIRGSEFKKWGKNKGSTASLRKIKKTSLDKRKLKDGDILVEISGGGPDQPVGRTVLIDEEALSHHIEYPKVCTNFVRLTRPYNKIESGYLNYFLRYFYFSGEVVRYQGGSNNLRNLKFKEYITIAVPIPPLNEQIRIANKLDSLLAKVEAAQNRLEKIPVLLKRFRQSVLAAATSGELTREWRGTIEFCEINEKYSAPVTWKLGKLIAFCSVITSGSRGWAKFYAESGATFIRAQNLNSDNLNLDDIAHVHLPEKVEGKRTSVSRNDLLITITGANVTKAAMVKIDLEEAYVSQHVALIKLNDQELSPFLELFLQAENSGRGQLKELAYGGGKPGLNLQNIKDLDVAVPPLEEQTEIVRRVESLFAQADKAETQYKAAKTRLDKLTQSILAKAFRGELVPQDPNDEPASELLKRIQAERENQLAEQKTAKKKQPKVNQPKKTKVTAMTLEDAPDDYLFELLKKNNGEIHAEMLWKQSGLSIDDFYAKLKKEMKKYNIIDHNSSPDPSLRKLMLEATESSSI